MEMNSSIIEGTNITTDFSISSSPATPILQQEWESINMTIQQLTMKVIYITIGTIGIVGNAFVVIVVISMGAMRKKLTNVFIVNQSVIDLVTACFLLLTSVIEDDGRSLKTDLADEMYCRLWLSKVPLWSMIFSSTYNLAALTVERYLEVVNPIWHKTSFTRNKVYGILVAVWLVGPIVNIAYNVPTSAVDEDQGKCRMLEIWPNSTTQQLGGIVAVALQYFVPIGILGYSYGRMAYSLRKRMTVIHVSPLTPSLQHRSVQSSGENFSKRKRNVIKTLAIVSTAFILCTSWNQWFFLFFNLGLLDYTSFSGYYYHFSVVAMFCTCCVNPFIYTAKYKQFQRGLRRFVCCNNTLTKEARTTTTTTTN